MTLSTNNSYKFNRNQPNRFFRNLVEIVSLRYVINVIRWCLVN